MRKIILLGLSLVLALGMFSGLFGQIVLYTWDFSSSTPNGWAVVNAGSGNNWSLIGSGNAYSGTNHMQYQSHSTYAANTWAFTRSISMTAGKFYYLTFYQKVADSSRPENLKVTVGNAQTVASQTTTLLTLSSVTNTTYTQRTTAYFRPTTTGNYYFAFNCYSDNNMGSLYVDYVQALVIDNNPTAFTAKVGGHSQVNLSWTLNPASENVLLAWNTANTFGTPSGSYNQGDQITGGGSVLLANSSAISFNHTGLNPNTTYYYRIWSYNGVGPTYSNGTLAYAKTLMAPITSFPWTEDLTGVLSSSLPTGWSKTGTNAHWYASTSNLAGGSSPEFIFEGSQSGTGTFRLITPQFDGNIDDLMLSFKHYLSCRNIPATYSVQYTTDVGNTWHTLWSAVDPTANIGPTTQVIDLSSIDTVFQLAWVYESSTIYYNSWYVDDISVRLAMPEIAISESFYDFGLAYYDTGSNCTPRCFIIENTGVRPLTISSAPHFTGMDASEFTLIDANTYPIVLDATESINWGVKFTPTSFGEKTAFLSIIDDIGAKGLSFFSADEITEATEGEKAASNLTAKSLDAQPATTAETWGTNNISLRGFGIMNVYEDYFETYDHLSEDLDPWTQYDCDATATWDLYDMNNGYLLVPSYTGSFICLGFSGYFPVPDDAWKPYGGDKYVGCAVANGVQNDDWLITPRLSFRERPRISFFAKSLYGRPEECKSSPNRAYTERFNVLYSTTGNSYMDFGTNYLNSIQPQTVGLDWTLFEYELPAVCANNNNVYIAIQCVSNQIFMLMIDDFVAGDYFEVHATPVEFSSFTASFTVDNYVNLNWTTQSETGVHGFYILRNTQDDLAHATVISPLVPATNTSQEQTYVFTDNELYEDDTYYYWLQNSDLDGTVGYHGPISIIYTSSGGDTPGIPLETELKPIYPNPFNPHAYIPFSLKESATVNIEIYNARGQLVRHIPIGDKAAGHYRTDWDGHDDQGRACGTGVYHIRMTAGTESFFRKAVLLK